MPRFLWRVSVAALLLVLHPTSSRHTLYDKMTSPPPPPVRGEGFRVSMSETCTLFNPENGHVVEVAGLKHASLLSAGDTHGGKGEGGEGKLEAQDTVRLGAYKGIHRFMLLSKLGSSKAELAGTDGVLGLGYSTEHGTASLLRTLSLPARKSWDIVQPSDFRELKPLVFAVAAAHDQGELQIGGYDPSAAVTPVRYARIHNTTHKSPYNVRLNKIRYGDEELLIFGDGGEPFTSATFDTGSDCLLLPDRAGGSLEASPFRALLAAHTKHGRRALTFELQVLFGCV